MKKFYLFSITDIGVGRKRAPSDKKIKEISSGKREIGRGDWSSLASQS